MKHTHDCDICQYLGEYSGKFDLYFCPGSERTVIARYGEDGKYLSGTIFGYNAICRGDVNHPLAQALFKALDAGLITWSEAKNSA